MRDQALGYSLRGFLHRTVSVLLLSALSGLLLIIPSVSSETDGAALGNVSLYSDWWEEGSLDDDFDDDIVGGAADFSVGSFSLHRPQSEMFMKGLLGKVYNIAAAAAVEGSDIENYLQARARAQIMNTAAPDFKRWLSSRGEGITDRIFINSADYLTDYLSASAVDNAESLSFIRTIEWDYQTALGDRRWQSGISALGALREGADDAVAWQLRGYAAEDSGTGANAGLIYRRAVDLGGETLVGANVFLDYEENGDYGEDFLRWSAGAEYRNAHLDIYLNRYFPLSDGVLHDGDYLYTQGGDETYINLKIPESSIGKFSAGFTYYRWEGEYGDADDKGLRYHIRYSPHWYDWRFELEVHSADGETPSVGGRISYRRIIGGAKTGVGIAPAQTAFDARSHFFESLRREYAQRIRRNNEKARIVVARVLDDSGGTAELAILETATSTAATVVILSAVDGVGQAHTLTLSARTISITVEMGTALELSASNWLVTIYEGGIDRLAETGGRLEIVESSTAFERFGDGLNTLQAENITIDLLGTKGKVGRPDPPSRYGFFTHLVDGDIALTVLARNRMSVELFGFAATAIVDLPPAFFALEDTEATVQLTLACSTDEQRDNHRIFQEDYAGCVGDVRISGLANGERLSLHTQGRNLTLVGTTGINGEVSIAVVDATGFTLTSTWDSYPFHPHNATLEVFNDAVSIFHGRESGELAALGVAANSKVAFVFADAAAGATATTAVSIYAAVFAGAVSDIGAGGVVDCVGNSAPLSEGLVSVVATCGGVFFGPGDEMDIIGRVGLEHMREVEVTGGGGIYDFELVGADSNLALLSPTGAVAMLMVSPDKALYDNLANSPADSAEYRLRASPLPPFDVFAADAQLDIHLHVLEGFAVSHAPATDDAVRTEIDENVLLHNISYEGSTNDDVSISICLCPPPHPLHHSLLDHFAVGTRDGRLSIVAAIPSAEIAHRYPPNPPDNPATLGDTPQVVSLLVVAKDTHLNDDSLNATVSVTLPVTVRHPSGDVTSTYNYVSAERNGNYAVYDGAAQGDIFTFSDTGNIPDDNAVSVSGISVGGHYDYRVIGTMPSGFVLVTSDGPGVFAALQIDGNSPPALGQYDIELAVDDDHSLTDPFLVTASVEIIPTFAGLALDFRGALQPLSAPHEVGNDLFTLVASGGNGGAGGANYRYALSGADSDKVRFVGFTGDASGVEEVIVELSEDVDLVGGAAQQLDVRVELNDGTSPAETKDVAVDLQAFDGLVLEVRGALLPSAHPHNEGDDLFTLVASGGNGGVNGANYEYVLSGADSDKVQFAGDPNGGTEVTIELDGVSDAGELQIAVELRDDGSSAPVFHRAAIELLTPLALDFRGALQALGAPHEVGNDLFTLVASGGNGGAGGANYRYALSGADSDKVQFVGFVGDASGVEEVIVELSEDVDLVGGAAQQLNVRVELNDGTSPAETKDVAVDLQAFDGLVLEVRGALLPSAHPHNEGDDLLTLVARGGNGGVNGANYEYVLSGADSDKVQFAGDPNGGTEVTIELDGVSDAGELQIAVELRDDGSSAPVFHRAAIELLTPLALDFRGALQALGAPHEVGNDLFTLVASGGNGGSGGANYRYALSGADSDKVQFVGFVGDASGVEEVIVELSEDVDLVGGAAQQLDVRVELNDGTSPAETKDVAVDLQAFDGLVLEVRGALLPSAHPHNEGDDLLTLVARGGNGGVNGANYEYVLSGADSDKVQFAGDPNGGTEVTIELDGVSDAGELQIAVELRDDGSSAPVFHRAAIELLTPLALDFRGALQALGAPHEVGNDLFTLVASGGNGGAGGANYRYALSGADSDKVQFVGFVGDASGVEEVIVELSEDVDLVGGAAQQLNVRVELNDGTSPAETKDVVVELQAFDGLVLEVRGALLPSAHPHNEGDDLLTLVARGGNGGVNGANYEYVLSGADSDKVQFAGDPNGGTEVTIELDGVSDAGELQIAVELRDDGSSAPVFHRAAIELLTPLALDFRGALQALGAPHEVGNDLFTLVASGGNGGAGGANYRYALSGADSDKVRFVGFTGDASGVEEVIVELSEDVDLVGGAAQQLDVRVELNDGTSPAETKDVVVELQAFDGLVLEVRGALLPSAHPHNEGDDLLTLVARGGNGGVNGANYEYVLSGADSDKVQFAGDPNGGTEVTIELDGVSDAGELQIAVELRDDGSSAPVFHRAAIELLTPLALDFRGALQALGAPHEVGNDLFTLVASGGNGGSGGANYRYALSGADSDKVQFVGFVGDASGVEEVIVELSEDVDLVGGAAQQLNVRVELNDGTSPAETKDVVVELQAFDGLVLEVRGALLPSAHPHNEGDDLLTLVARGGNGGVNGANYEYVLSGADSDKVQFAGDPNGGTEVTIELDGVSDAGELQIAVELRDDGSSAPVFHRAAIELLTPLALDFRGALQALGAPHEVGNDLFTLVASGGNGGSGGANYRYALSGADSDKVQFVGFVGDASGVEEVIVELSEDVDLVGGAAQQLDVRVELNDGTSPAETKDVAVDLQAFDGLVLEVRGALLPSAHPHNEGDDLLTLVARGGNGGVNGANYEYVLSGADSDKVQFVGDPNGGTEVTIELDGVSDAGELQIAVELRDDGSSAPVFHRAAIELLTPLALDFRGALQALGAPHEVGNDLFTLVASGGNGGSGGANYRYALSGADSDKVQFVGFTGDASGVEEVIVELSEDVDLVGGAAQQLNVRVELNDGTSPAETKDVAVDLQAFDGLVLEVRGALLPSAHPHNEGDDLLTLVARGGNGGVNGANYEYVLSGADSDKVQFAGDPNGGTEVTIELDGVSDAGELQIAVELRDDGSSAPVFHRAAIELLTPLALDFRGALQALGAPHEVGNDLFTLVASGGNGGSGGANYRYALSGADSDKVQFVGFVGDASGVEEVIVELSEDVDLVGGAAQQLDVRVELNDGTSPAETKDVAVDLQAFDGLVLEVRGALLPSAHPHNEGDDLLTLVARGGNGGVNGANYEYVLSGADSDKVQFAGDPNGGTEVTIELDGVSDAGELQIAVELRDDGSSAPVFHRAAIELLTPLALDFRGALQALGAPHEVGNDLFTLVASGGNGGAGGANYRYALSGADSDKVQFVGFVGDASGVEEVIVELSEDVDLVGGAAQQLNVRVELNDGTSPAETKDVAVDLQAFDGLVLEVRGALLPSAHPHNEGDDLLTLVARGGNGGVNGANYEYVLSGADSDKVQFAGDPNGGTEVTIELDGVSDAGELQIAVELRDDGSSAPVFHRAAIELLTPLALDFRGALQALGAPHEVGNDLFTLVASGGNGGSGGANYRYALSGADSDKVQFVGFVGDASGVEEVIVELSEDVDLVGGAAQQLNVRVELNDGTSPAETKDVVVELQAFDGLVLEVRGALLPSAHPHNEGDDLLTLVARGGNGGVNGANYEYVLSGADSDKVQFAGDPNGGTEVTIELDGVSDAGELQIAVELRDDGSSAPVFHRAAIELLTPLALDFRGALQALGAPHEVGNDLFTLVASGGNGGSGGANYRYALSGADSDKVQFVGFVGDASGVEEVIVELSEDVDLVGGAAQQLDVRVELNDGTSPAETKDVAVDLQAFDGLVLEVRGALLPSAHPHNEGDDLLTLVARGGNGGVNGANYEYVLSGADSDKVQFVGDPNGGTEVTIELDGVSDAGELQIAVELRDDGSSAPVFHRAAIELLTPLALDFRGALQALGAPHEVGNDLFTLVASGGNGGSGGANYRYALSGADSDKVQFVGFTGDASGVEEVIVELSEDVDLVGGAAQQLNVRVELNDGTSPAETKDVAVDLQAFDGLVLEVRGALLPSAHPHNEGDDLLTLVARGGNGGVNGANYEYVLSGADSDKVQFAGDPNGGTEVTIELDGVSDAGELQIAVELRDDGSSAPVFHRAAIELLTPLALDFRGALQALGAPHEVGNDLFTLVASGGNGGSGGANYRYALSGADSDKVQFVGFVGDASGVEEVIVELSEDVDLVGGAAQQLNVRVELNDGTSPAETKDVVVELQAFDGLALSDPGLVVLPHPHERNDELFVLTVRGGDGNYSYALTSDDSDVLRLVISDDGTEVKFKLLSPVNSNLPRVLSVTLAVSEVRSEASATRAVTVNLLASLSLVLTGPTEVNSSGPHRIGEELFQVQTTGGSGSYSYEIVSVNPTQRFDLSNIEAVADAGNPNIGLVRIKGEVKPIFNSQGARIRVRASDNNISASGEIEVIVRLLSRQRVLVIGGKTIVEGNNRLNDVWSSEDGGQSWTELSGRRFSARSGHAATALGGTVWLFGGNSVTINSSGVTVTTRLQDTWISEDNGSNWTERRRVLFPLPRSSYHKMLTHNGTIFFIGGIGSDGAPLNDVWTSTDGRRWSFSGTLDNDRNPLMVFVYKGTVMVGGVRNIDPDASEQTNRNNRAFRAYNVHGTPDDLSDDTWDIVPDNVVPILPEALYTEDESLTGSASADGAPLDPHDQVPYIGAAGTAFNNTIFIYARNHIWYTDGTAWVRESTNAPYAYLYNRVSRPPLNMVGLDRSFPGRRVGYQLGVLGEGKNLLLISGIMDNVDADLADEGGTVWRSTDGRVWPEVPLAGTLDRAVFPRRYGHAVVVYR